MVTCPDCGEELSEAFQTNGQEAKGPDTDLSATALTSWLRYGFLGIALLGLLVWIFGLYIEVVVQEILGMTGSDFAQTMTVIYGLLIVLYVLVFVPLGIMFLVWMYKSFSNLKQLNVDVDRLNYSPGWAVGSFFVPVMDCIWPYYAVKEMWFASEVGRAQYTPESFESESLPWRIRTWWACFILSALLSYTGDLSPDAPELVVRYLAIGVGSLIWVLRIASAILAAEVVVMIHRRQVEKWKTLNRGTGSGLTADQL